MKTLKSASTLLRWGTVAVLLLSTAFLTRAQTYWNGPETSFYNPGVSGDVATDDITADVEITRGTDSGGLYNAFDEGGASSGTSPDGTLWAEGTLSQYTNDPDSFDFEPCLLEAGNSPPGYVGTTFVVYLVNDNIYLELTLTNWGGQGGNGPKNFGYLRSTAPAVAPIVAVTITNPANNSVFAAPANVHLGANATVSSGTVTNVQFYANNSSVGSVTASPFNFTANNLAAGNYAITAAATAAGISVTSGPVNISVVTPVTVGLTKSARSSQTSFQFSYSANAGLGYVIQRATNMFSPNWVSLVTNVAASNPTNFVDSHATNNPVFYRVGRLPNP